MVLNVQHPGQVPPARRILLIIPAYNEAESLRTLIPQVRADCPECDLIVIDDGSSDLTAPVLKELRVRVISLPCNLGIGGAVQTGLQLALRERYEVAVQLDGDGQHPPSEVAKLLSVMRNSGCDVALGSRFREREGFQSTFTRRVGIRFFSWMVSKACNAEVSDATSGFRAMNRKAMAVLAHNYTETYPEVEALLQLHRAGLRIAEVPVQMSKRMAGRSSIGMLQAASYMMSVTLAILMGFVRKDKMNLRAGS